MQDRLKKLMLPKFLQDEALDKLDCLSKINQEKLNNVFQIYKKGHINKNTYGVHSRGMIEELKQDPLALKIPIRISDDEKEAALLQENDFWDQCRSTSLIGLFSTVRRKIKEEDLHFTQSTDFLRYQHEKLLPVIKEWILFAELECANKNDQLSRHFYLSFQAYLEKLKKFVSTEEKRIKTLSFNRFMTLLDEGENILDDDHLFHFREKLKTHAIRISPDLSQAEKEDITFIRQGYHPKTFDYFFSQWEIEYLSRLYEKLLPKAVYQTLIITNQRPKLSLHFSPARKKCILFFSQHAYQVAQVHIRLRCIENTMNTLKITYWDDFYVTKIIENMYNVEKQLEQLIKIVEKETPKGFWPSLFQKETIALFHHYKNDLQNKITTVRLNKETLKRTIEDWSMQQPVLFFQEAIYLNFNQIIQIRSFLQETDDNHIHDYALKTDMLNQFMEEMISPQKLYLPEEEILFLESTFTIRRVNHRALKKVIALAEGSTSDKNQKKAVLVLQNLLLGDEATLKKEIISIKKYFFFLLKGTTEEKEIAFSQMMKNIIYRYLYPQIGTAQSFVFAFIQRYDDYAHQTFAKTWKNQNGEFATDAYLALKDKLSRLPITIEKNDAKIIEQIVLIRATVSIKIHYYPELITLIMTLIEQSLFSPNIVFDDIINQLGDDELIAQYGCKLLSNLLNKKDYTSIRNDSFLTLHFNHPLFSLVVREQFLQALNTDHAIQFYQLCWQFCAMDDKIVQKIESVRLHYVEGLRKKFANESEIIAFIAHIKHSPYYFPMTTEGKEALALFLGPYDPKWGRQQKLLYTYADILKASQEFYNSWLKGLLLNQHQDTTLLTANQLGDIVECFGEENLKNYLYPFVLENLDKNLSLATLHILQTIFTDNLTTFLTLPSLTKPFFIAMAKINGQQRGKKEWEQLRKEYEKLNPLMKSSTEFFIKKIIEMNEVRDFHEDALESEIFIYADIFLQQVTLYLHEAIFQAVLTSSFGLAYHLHRIINHVPDSEIKNNGNNLYDRRYEIILANMGFINALTFDLVGFIRKKTIAQHVLLINELILDNVQYTKFLKNEVHHEQIRILKNLSEKLLINNPMKACFIYTAKYLEEGKNSLTAEELTYITYHDDFKLTLDAIFAIATDKILPVKSENLKQHIQYLMKSPYSKEIYKPFWQEIFESCKDKSRVHDIILLIHHLGTSKQKQFFIKNINENTDHQCHYTNYGILPGQEFIDELSQNKKSLQQIENAHERMFHTPQSFTMFIKESHLTIDKHFEKLKCLHY